MNTPKRYHPLMVIMHWLTVIVLLGAGFLSEDESGSSPVKIHMIFGVVLFVVMLVRLIVRFSVKLPEWANTGNPMLNKLGEWVHLGLYAAVFSILALGGLIASKRNLLEVALGTGSVERVRLGAIGALHHLGWLAVMGLLLLHIGGALYHQFILKDNLMSRMGFGRG